VAAPIHDTLLEAGLRGKFDVHLGESSRRLSTDHRLGSTRDEKCGFRDESGHSVSTQSTIAAPQFTVALPDAVMVRPTCTVEVTELKLILSYAGRQLTMAGPNTLVGYALTPLAEGRVLTTSGLTPAARRLLTSLAARGLLVDPDQPGGADSAEGSSGINTIGCFADENFRLSQEIPSHSDDNWAHFLSGGFAPNWLRASFLENYHFTNSAAFHITPVLDHDLSGLSRAAWLQFLADEIPHYRIWRPAFSSFGWSYSAVQRQLPREPTAWLIESCRGAAAHSELAYLGVLMKIEMAPLESHYSQSPHYGTLLTQYGLPETAVRPLWWHTTENVTAGHSYMPATLLSQLGPICADELNDAFSYLRLHYLSMRYFNDEIAATFGLAHSELPDLT
jgi:hypothetical protein